MRIVFGLLLVLVASTCFAGPGFNLSRGDLVKLSDDAGAELQGSLANVHLMLQFLEQGQPDAARNSNTDALKALDIAIGFYKKIENGAPNQPLILDNKLPEQQARAVELLRRQLEARKIPFPKTEKELASLATQIVNQFRNAVAAVKSFDKTTRRNYPYFEQLYREEAYLLNIGLLCSIVWEAQQGPALT